MSRKSLQTPQDRRSMLGLGSVTKQKQQKKPPEQKRLTFSANRSRVGGKRWSSQGSHQIKDPRPLSNRTYQKEMIEEILEFLSESGYPHQVSAKIMSAPTTKEFLRVFEHLYSFINPNFKMDKKYEEEVPRILKSLNYPFTISKSVMFAIGSLHQWPTLLGALQWLVELIRTVNAVDVEQMLFPTSFAEDESCAHQKKIFFEYYTHAYKDFMRGTDDFSEAYELMHEALTKQPGCSAEDLDALKDEVADLEQEVAQLEAEPDCLEEAIKIKTSLEEKIEQDLVKISECDQESDVLKQQYLQYQVHIREEGIDCALLGDAARQEEIKHKSSEVKLQLERLNTEKERLEQQNCEREMRYSKQYDKVMTTVNKYNDIARELALNPRISQYLGEDTLVLHFDHNKKDLQGLNDFKHRLKPLLIKLHNQVAEDRCQIETQKITEEEKLDKMSELCAEMECQLSQLKKQITSIDKELENHKVIMEQEYQISVDKVHAQEEFLEKKKHEITQALDDELKELSSAKKRDDTLQGQQVAEQNAYAMHLVKYCQEVEKHKNLIEGQILSVNAMLKEEIESTEKQNEIFRENED